MEVKKRAELVETISKLVDLLSEEEKKQVFSQAFSKEGFLPISIFRSDLSGLEAITTYLKDHQQKSLKEIAELLNRKASTIYTTYHKAGQKKAVLDCADFSISIPINIFADRRFSVLESLVAYLKDGQQIKLSKIAVLLNKNYSTIKTVYKRYQDKCQ